MGRIWLGMRGLVRSYATLAITHATLQYGVVYVYFCLWITAGARGSAVGWGTMLQAGRSLDRVPIRSLDFFKWPNPSSRTMALGWTQPLTEMSTRNLPGRGGKGRPVREADIFRHLWTDRLDKIWEPPLLTTLWAFTACYRVIFTFTVWITTLYIRNLK
jgi:hypothetical protein